MMFQVALCMLLFLLIWIWSRIKTFCRPYLEIDFKTLWVLKHCLCIYASGEMFMDVSIMKEYENKKSWTKLYSVPNMRERRLCKALYIF